MVRPGDELTVLGALTLPGVARSVAFARRFARDMLGPDHSALDDVQLCLSELVTNAIAHTDSGDGGRVTVVIASAAHLIHVDVVDDGAAENEPYIRDSLDAEDGRGMYLVDSVAAKWGVTTDDSGTTTWFQIAC